MQHVFVKKPCYNFTSAICCCNLYQSTMASTQQANHLTNRKRKATDMEQHQKNRPRQTSEMQSFPFLKFYDRLQQLPFSHPSQLLSSASGNNKNGLTAGINLCFAVNVFVHPVCTTLSHVLVPEVVFLLMVPTLSKLIPCLSTLCLAPLFFLLLSL